ncbi:hypothetical protein BU16DRAFT_526861 [Lophium mytilinum]|uniref:CFEM domain-containing protein n=1 Tax=Lophium mytilinum TaxID=390894 RepID=A0A6A6QVE6_9PEZI|nr:hypothetical protein BU16DRAFT_526861 [Lophium mytilinum]
MLLSRLSLLSAFALVVSVSADSGFVDSLPKCWRSCVADTNLNCDGWDLPCICKASKGTFLTDTVSCARSDCDSDNMDVQLFLGPLELLCDTVKQPIPNSIIKSAENCATQTASAKAISTAKPASEKHHHTDKSQDYITSTYTSTITETRTDSQGSTVYVIIPVVVEPSTVVYGKPETSVAGGGDDETTTFEQSTLVMSASPLDSSTAAAATTTGPQKAEQTATSTSSSKKAGPSDNGSPFENMQAAASTRERSWGLAVFGLLAALV